MKHPFQPKFKRSKRILLILLTLTIPVITSAEGGEKEPERKDTIDFSGARVEGLHKKPLDSLNQIQEKNYKNKHHLYNKNESFRKDTEHTLKMMRWTP